MVHCLAEVNPGTSAYRTLVVLELLCWPTDLRCLQCLRAGFVQLVGRARAHGVLASASVLSGKLGSLWQPAFWWVELCSHPANGLAWDVSGMVLITWLEAIEKIPKWHLMVEWAPPNRSCQFSTSLGFTCLLSFQETVKDQEVHLTHASFKLLLLLWVPKYMRFFVSLLRDGLCFPQPSGSPETKPHWPLKPNILGASLPSPGFGGLNILFLRDNLCSPMDRGAWWATVPGVSKSQTWLSNWLSAVVLTHLFVGCPTWYGSLPPVSLWFLFSAWL